MWSYFLSCVIVGVFRRTFVTSVGRNWIVQAKYQLMGEIFCVFVAFLSLGVGQDQSTGCKMRMMKGVKSTVPGIPA